MKLDLRLAGGADPIGGRSIVTTRKKSPAQPRSGGATGSAAVSRLRSTTQEEGAEGLLYLQVSLNGDYAAGRRQAPALRNKAAVRAARSSVSAISALATIFSAGSSK
jgi:hypothetical protein